MGKYRDLVDDDEEAWYNFGRFYHNVGILYLAVEFYSKVIKGNGRLKWAAGHNLAMLYFGSGSPNLARKVLQNCCTF
jgi:tetratricopeptide (TPR) repeat protein